eukprot:scaffold543_cov119-Cylindrotheca_fusiformis.AAC.1
MSCWMSQLSSISFELFSLGSIDWNGEGADTIKEHKPRNTRGNTTILTAGKQKGLSEAFQAHAPDPPHFAALLQEGRLGSPLQHPRIGGGDVGAHDTSTDGLSDNEGIPDGAIDGLLDAVIDGLLDGAIDGATDGLLDTVIDGLLDGAIDGATDGVLDAVIDGLLDGAIDGLPDGLLDA